MKFISLSGHNCGHLLRAMGRCKCQEETDRDSTPKDRQAKGSKEPLKVTDINLGNSTFAMYNFDLNFLINRQEDLRLNKTSAS